MDKMKVYIFNEADNGNVLTKEPVKAFRKIYVRQVDPEYQESHIIEDLFNGDFELNGAVITGNRNFRGYTTPAYDRWKNNWEDCAGMISEHGIGSELEIIEDWFPQVETEPEEIKQKWVKLFNEILDLKIKIFPRYFNSAMEDDFTCRGLSLLEHTEYKMQYIHGCCQGDWQKLFYDANFWSDKSIRLLEDEYFNTGSEWIVDDEHETIEDPDDISGYSVYIVDDWNDQMIRQSLAETIGCKPEDLVIFKHDGYVRKAKYKEVK